MILKEIIIHPQSTFRTPIRSDTLTGQILWEMLYEKGQDFFYDFLDKFTQSPQFVLSNGFQKGYIPKPIYYFENANNPETPEERKKEKKAKKVNQIPLQELSKSGFTIDYEKLTGITEKEISKPKYSKTILTEHNTIDRIIGTTYQEGGGYYTLEEYSFQTDISIYAYVQDEDTLENLLKYLQNIGKQGFGADASVGKGVFSVDEKINEIEIDETQANCFINLSTGTINPADGLQKGYYKFFTRFGKLGGSLAMFGSPYKQPILMFEPGSVFFVNDNKFKSFYGTAIKGVHSIETIIHPAYMLPLPVEIKNR